MTLQPKTIELLRKVQDILREGHPKHGFNMNHFRVEIDSDCEDKSSMNHKCGTAMCIGGWMGFVAGGGIETSVSFIGNETFGRLFFIGEETDLEYEEATPTHAVKAIEQFIATDGEKAWDGIK